EVKGDARRKLVVPVVKDDPVGEHLPHHRDHVVYLERHADLRVAHAASRGVGHLGILQVIARAGKQVVVPAVVVVEVRDDHVFDRVGTYAERIQSFGDRLDDGAATGGGHRLVEPGVHEEGPARAHDRPDEVVERLQDVVRVAVEEVLGRL